MTKTCQSQGSEVPMSVCTPKFPATFLSSKLPPTEVTLFNTQEAMDMESKNTLKTPYSNAA